MSGWIWVWLLGAARAGGGPIEDPGLARVQEWILETPRTRFYDEVDALVRAHPLPAWLQPSPIPTCEGEALDLAAALGPPAADLARAWSRARCTGLPSAELLARVPTEFRLYAEGVAAMHAGDLAAARARWRELLALPGAERHWRSTWAAYMLGNLAWAEGEPPDPHWRRVEALARDGFADTLGLALLAGRYDDDPSRRFRSALGLLPRDRSSQWTGDQLPSMVRALLDGPRDELVAAAAEPLVSDVVSAWLVSRRADDPHRSARASRWLDVAEAAGQVAGSGRLASVAYQEGDFGAARRWVARAEPLDPLAAWIEAKLALMDGDRDGAIVALQRASRLLGREGSLGFLGRPELYCRNDRIEVVGGGRCASRELGALLLSAGRFEEALQAFLSAGDWLDAAWVAERVLTVDELAVFCERWAPPGALEEVPRQLQHLLARRLARLDRWDEALRWFPDGVVPRAEAVRDALRRGHDPAVPAPERASALWGAARAMKSDGWSLLATEMAPDHAAAGGWFELDDVRRGRLEGSDPPGPSSPSEAERRRLAADPTRPERYQFVYTAYDLADEAAALLPDQTGALAEVLCTAGTWMRHRDTMRSSQMWFLLLRRAHRTDIARTARTVGGWWGLDERGVCVAQPAPARAPTPWPGALFGVALAVAFAAVAAALRFTWRERPTGS